MTIFQAWAEQSIEDIKRLKWLFWKPKHYYQTYKENPSFWSSAITLILFVLFSILLNWPFNLLDSIVHPEWIRHKTSIIPELLESILDQWRLFIPAFWIFLLLLLQKNRLSFSACLFILVSCSLFAGCVQRFLYDILWLLFPADFASHMMPSNPIAFWIQTTRTGIDIWALFLFYKALRVFTSLTRPRIYLTLLFAQFHPFVIYGFVLTYIFRQ